MSEQLTAEASDIDAQIALQYNGATNEKYM